MPIPTPFFTDDQLSFDQPIYLPDVESANNASLGLRQAAAQTTFGTQGLSHDLASPLAAAAIGSVADLPDQILSSVGAIDRGSLNQKALAAIGVPGLTQWYNQNRGAIEVGSGISSLVASEFAAAKFLRAGSAAMEVIKGVPYVGRIAKLDDDYNRAMSLAQATQMQVAAQAISGSAQYNTAVTFARLGRPALEITSNQARARLVGYGVARGAARNLTATSFLALAANQNSFLFSDDMSENLWAIGLGLGVGAFADQLMTKYAFKKFANSDTLNRIWARTLDPNETEEARLSANLFNKKLPSKRFNPYAELHDDDTDLATSLALSVAEARNPVGIETPKQKAVFGRLNSLADQQEQHLRDTLQKATMGGIAGVGHTAFSLDSPAGKTLAQTIHKDPTAVFSVSEIGRIAEDSSSSIIAAARQIGIDDRLNTLQKAFVDDGWAFKKNDGSIGIRKFKDGEKDKLLSEYQRLVYRNSGIESHLIDGEWVPAQVGRMFDGIQEPEIIKEGENLFQPKGMKLGVQTDGTVIKPKGFNFATMSLDQTLGLYRSARKALDSIIANPDSKLILQKKPHWFSLDMAEQLIRDTGDENRVVWSDGLSRETAAVESFKQKVSAALAAGLDDPESTEAQLMRYRFNLPRLSANESGLLGTSEHPIEHLFRGAVGADLENLTYQDLLKGFADIRQINGITDLAKDRGDQIIGNMFTFNLGNDGKPMERLIAWKRPTAPFQWTKSDLAERLAMAKAVQRRVLVDENAGAMTRGLTQRLLADPNFRIATQVDSLQDIQMAPSIPGFGSAAPQTRRGAVLNDITVREFRDRDNPVLLAAGRIQSDNNREVLAWIRRKIEPVMSRVNDALHAPANVRSKTLADQFLTYRPGWEFKMIPAKGGKGKTIATKFVQLPDGSGGRAFILDGKVDSNREAWKELFGREMNPEGEVLTAPNGTQIVLDDLAWDWMVRFDSLAGGDLLAEKNTLNRARGLSEINRVPLYSPPPNVQGKIVGFTVGPDGRTVRGGSIVADTPEEFNRKLARLRDPNNKASPLNRPGHMFYRKDEIENFSNIWDRAEMDWRDPHLTPNQPGQRSRGVLTGNEINPNATQEAMLWLRNSYLRHGNDIKNFLFDNPIKSAIARAGISRESTTDALGRKVANQNSIYDYYLQNILGRMAYKSPASPLGRIMNEMTEFFDGYLKEINPHQSTVLKAAIEFTKRHIPGQTGDQEVFEKLKKDLGDYMPFKKVSEYIAVKYDKGNRADLAAITSKMNQFEAASRLRMFEVIQGLMNLGGIVNAAPAVIRSMQKLPGESDSDFAQRVGHVATIFRLRDGKTIGVPSMPKLIYESFKDTWNRTSNSAWQYRVSRGYMTQEAAEYHRNWGVTNTMPGWQKFVKKIVDYTSFLSDRSEDFSRSWAHIMGAKLAKHMGVATFEAQEAFAHDIANKMIANYDPLNRPAIFQGALGAPIGLFQSYLINFYGRMFRYLETGDWRSLATQYATQAGLFGIGTVPGWDQINGLVFNHGTNPDDPLHGVYERFGTEAGDWLMGGVISNLPRLINLLPGEQGVDGIALYSRGDTNVRLPGVGVSTAKVKVAGREITLPSIPMFDTIARVYNGIGDAISAFSLNHPKRSIQQLAEIASNTITNRPIAGLIEQTLAGGFDTDSVGNVAAHSQNAMEEIDRVLGVRSMREAKELQAFYSQKTARETQNALRQWLNEKSKAAVRAGDLDALPEYFSEYVRKGGDPRRFNQWVRYISKNATNTRAENLLQSLTNSKNPANAQFMQQLLDFGVSIGDDEDDSSNPYDLTDYDSLPGGIGQPGGGNITPIPIEPNDAAPGFEYNGG